MQPSDLLAALQAAKAMALALGLVADDAVILQDSNRLAVRLLPCDTLARVAHVAHEADAGFEVEVARRLAGTDSPIATLDPRVEPRVYVQDGFAITFWTYYEPVAPEDIAPAEYADALERLHACMREVDLPSPHVTDRIAEAQLLIDNRDFSPDLDDGDRELLSGALRRLRSMIEQRGVGEQLLHGEPHHGNLLRTKHGLLFIDLQTCCRGPVEFDIAHCSRPLSVVGGMSWSFECDVPRSVCETYSGADPELVDACWVLMLGMVAAWRWDLRDDFPDGRRMGIELVSQVRAALDCLAIP